MEIGQPPPEQMHGQRGAPVETQRPSRFRGALGEDEEEANHRREDDGWDEHDEENHGNYCLATPFAAFAMRSATARGCDT